MMYEHTRIKLTRALAKPLPASSDTISIDDFDPWEDVICNIHGGYASESDRLMIAALEAVRDRKTFEFIKKDGFAGELVLYILSGNHLINYGTSPRGGWPMHEDLWQTLIDKWKAYAAIVWGDDEDGGK